MTYKAFLSVSLLALTIAGCGDSSTPATSPAPAPAPAAPGSTADALKATAEKLLADVAKYISEHKWELAEKGVAELEGMKAKLPPEYGPRIDQLKSGLATAKAAADKLPALPR